MARKKTTARCLLVGQLVLSVSLVGLPHSVRAQPKMEAATETEEEMSGGGSIEIPIAPMQEEVMDVGRTGAAAGATNIPLEEPLNPDLYLCGSGDSFELRFWGKQNMSIRLATDLEGNTFIPKVGKVQVAGKSLTTARGLILRAVKRYYPGLNTDLSLLKSREFLIHVVGEVKKPGLVKANPRRRLSAVIEQAGGSTGTIRRIEIRRKGALVVADLLMYQRTGDTKYNPYVLDGDVVHVPKAGMLVGIGGPVRDPGRYELVATRDMDELMDLAGGFRSSTAYSLPIRITRRDRNERSVTIKLKIAKGERPPNIPLQDDDLVAVSGTGELERTIMLVGAVVGADPADPATTVKRLQYVEGDTVRSLIERAGGVTVAADLQNAYIRRTGEPLVLLDLESLLVRRDFRVDRRVQVGDTIVVPFKRRSVLVEGAVMRAGSFQYDPRFGVHEYLASAGGMTRYAKDTDEIRLVGADGKMRDFGENLKVNPGDTIVVPERNFSRAEIVQILISGAGIVISAAALAYAVGQ